MSEFKHTPAPWIAQKASHGTRAGKMYYRRRIYRESPNGAVRHVADVSGDIGPVEVTDANASLISSAPELLQVAEMFVAMWDKRKLASPHEPMLAEEHELILSLAQRAVAKAKGGCNENG